MIVGDCCLPIYRKIYLCVFISRAHILIYFLYLFSEKHRKPWHLYSSTGIVFMSLKHLSNCCEWIHNTVNIQPCTVRLEGKYQQWHALTGCDSLESDIFLSPLWLTVLVLYVLLSGWESWAVSQLPLPG